MITETRLQVQRFRYDYGHDPATTGAVIWVDATGFQCSCGKSFAVQDRNPCLDELRGQFYAAHSLCDGGTVDPVTGASVD